MNTTYRGKTLSPQRGAIRRTAAFALQIYMVSIVAGCVGEAPEAPVLATEAMEVIVEPAQLTLQAGGEAWLRAQANDAAGQPVGGAGFRYVAKDPRVLQVSGSGLVTSLGPTTSRTHVLVASGPRERLVPVAVMPGPPQRIEKLAGDGQQVVAGQPLAEAFLVRLLDGHGNALENQPVSITSASGQFSPEQALTAADGTARFEVSGLDRAGTAIVFVRSTEVPATVESFQVQVLAGPPAAIRLAPPAAAPAAAPGGAVVLQVTDAFGNPLPDVEFSARLADSGAEPLRLRSDADGLARVPSPAAGTPARLEVVLDGDPPFRETLVIEAASVQPAAAAS